MLKIRLATEKDFPAIISLVDSWHNDAANDNGIMVDCEKLKKNLKKMLDENLILLISYGGVVVGGMAGYRVGTLFNSDVFFLVMFFYVCRNYRNLVKEILLGIERFLLTENINKITFAVIENAKAKKYIRFYKMMGYNKLETHMIKRLA